MKTHILLKITLPPILCLLTIFITKMGIEYYPLSFALIIAVINWNNHKYGLLSGLILSLGASYISFYSAYFLVYLLMLMFKPIFGQDMGGLISFTISVFIVAPFLVLFLYKFVFFYSITKLIRYVIFCTIFILLVVSLLSDYFTGYKFLRFLKRISIDQYAFWQIIMASALQIIIYQDELFSKGTN